MKRFLFISGTRADFGKIKPLIESVKNSELYDYKVFVTGMHLMKKYGGTAREIEASGFTKSFSYMNQKEGDDMEIVLANTISGLSRFLSEYDNQFDAIIVHGDRVEALAGAIVGALRNIMVCHIEGGEVSGTVDELLRHAISKLSHVHCVTNCKARERLIQLGENPESIFEIGSPDIDVMLSDKLPDLSTVKEHYEIKFDNYAIGIFHPVTTDLAGLSQQIKVFVDSIIESNKNFILIYPNNDKGEDIILREYKRLADFSRVKLYPSLRFEYFLTLLKNADFIIGNSSAGIHEAPIYGVPTINLGNRQFNRFLSDSIINLAFDKAIIIDQILRLSEIKVRHSSNMSYGAGNSANLFIQAIGKWSNIETTQKYFIERKLC